VSDSDGGGTITTTLNIIDTNHQLGRFDGDYFDGLIDEVRIYNRALSAAEVQKLYNMGR
jgi:hypothetical protein